MNYFDFMIVESKILSSNGLTKYILDGQNKN